ncbi:MarR family winged helix-turn-helix transcriptional regulator [Parvularcula sp. IMCC14364]|uniref:MarR family winged helix-turn-helix transcriptional regulator n=1 Tax=Parvularcula sp. IMCC14364 TaxID=3067902 RepID=UPI0027412489|nr:MarR family transcriptional regulator [Parvularcula sp. IMCC14364]
MEAIKLETFLPYQLVLLADQISQRTSVIAREQSNLNLSQWRVMAAIADQPGASAQRIVSVTPMDKGIVSRAVKSLIDQGLVLRKSSHTDGRIGHLHLSEKGERLYSSISGQVQNFASRLEEGLSREERDAFVIMLQKLSTTF